MKKMIIAAAACLSAGILMSFAPPAGISKDQFCGKKWHATKMEAKGKSQVMKNDKSYYLYNTDGTMVSSKGEFTDNYNYEYDEASHTITMKGSDGTVNAKQEILKVDDKHMEMNQTLVGLGVTMKVYLEVQQ